MSVLYKGFVKGIIFVIIFIPAMPLSLRVVMAVVVMAVVVMVIVVPS
jgi:hypothetical protein